MGGKLESEGGGGEWKSGMNRHPEYLEIQWDSMGLWA